MTSLPLLKTATFRDLQVTSSADRLGKVSRGKIDFRGWSEWFEHYQFTG